MAKKQPKNDRTPREKTVLDADAIEAQAMDLASLAKLLSDIAEKMRVRNIPSIEAIGLANWQQGYSKIKSSTRSIERAYDEKSTASFKSKISEKRKASDQSAAEE